MKSPFVKRKPAEPHQQGSIIRKNRSISGVPIMNDPDKERLGVVIGTWTLRIVRSLHYVLLPLIYLSALWSKKSEFLKTLSIGVSLCFVMILPVMFTRFLANNFTAKEDEKSYKALGVQIFGTITHAATAIVLFSSLR